VKSEAYFRALGRYVQSLNGRYITAEDVNTNTKDMNYIRMETDYVSGIEGKSGNPSPVTARGAFHGIRAALKYKHELMMYHGLVMLSKVLDKLDTISFNTYLKPGQKKYISPKSMIVISIG
jgi:glutamate dehydrogenase/leucine dehydrogenase